MTSQRSVLIRSTLSQTQRTDVNLTAMEVYKLFTGGWYQYVQIFMSQEARTNMHNSLSHSELVQVCTLYSTNLFHQKLAQICTNLYLTRSRYKYV